MREQDATHLNEDKIAAALAGELDRVSPRRDLWPSIKAEVQRRRSKPRMRWLMPPFGSVSTLAGHVLALRPAGLALGSVAAALVLAWLLWSQPWQENLVRHGGEYWSAAKYDGFFQHQGVNPLVDTGENIRCSLNVNVDTASYIKAGRAVQNGRLPDPESVRVEDFINYFAEDYEPPGGGAFALRIEGGPSAQRLKELFSEVLGKPVEMRFEHSPRQKPEPSASAGGHLVQAARELGAQPAGPGATEGGQGGQG